MDVVVSHVFAVPEERGHCGVRRRLITHDAGAPLGVSHLNIQDARRHFHHYSYEIYYVLNGEGILKVDEQEIPLKQGTTVLIPPLHPHMAISTHDLEVLVIMAPPVAEHEDIEYVEPTVAEG